MLFAQQLFCVFGVHGTAVLNGQSLCSFAVVQFRNNAADEAVYFVSLLCSSGFAGADGPYRLVSDDHVFQFLFGNAHQSNFGLHRADLLGDAHLALLQQLANAQDHFQTCIQSSSYAFVHGNVGLAKVLTALGVADYNILYAHLSQHLSRDLAGECAGNSPVAVLCANFDVGAAGQLQSRLQIGVGNTDDNAAVSVFYQRFQLFDQRFCLGTGFVHFPVAGDNSLSFCFIHGFCLLLDDFYRLVIRNDGHGSFRAHRTTL